MKKRILFVDDERNVLDGLRRMLRTMRNEWEMGFVESGLEALELMRNQPFDVLVTDMRMPIMDGCQLLTRVKEVHPDIVRIILSGYSDLETTLKSVRVAHQCLAKPCDSETLKSTVARALAVRDLLANEALIRVVSLIEKLPSVPAIYQEVVREVNSPDTSVQKVGKIIARDVSMTAKVLHLANSAFFGVYQRINTLERALSLLGVDTVLALVVSVHIFSTHADASLTHFSIQALSEHSMRTAFLARFISEDEKQQRSEVDDAFMGGLLHDVGRLILAVNLSETYGEVVMLSENTGCTIIEAEQQVLGTTHAEVGAYLLGLWGLPEPIVEAAAFHHFPNRCPVRKFTPLTAVHLGNAFARTGQTGSPDEPADPLALDYLAEIHIMDRLTTWETACRSLIDQGAIDG